MAKNGRNRRSSEGVLLRAIEERDQPLRDHAGDVARLALAVGRALGLRAADLKRVAEAAELHDVGKLAIADRILDKSGPLDNREWQRMSEHPVIGQRILTAAPELDEVGAIVRWSHERYDGSGYPDGLRADEIPLASRIITVCDAFDAMTSRRAYSPAVALPDALAELRRCAGTQFDPTVVDAFCRLLETDAAA
jgi:HD-GYP domain-containing protein (c-di-GMP phosphodiesterase class II)